MPAEAVVGGLVKQRDVHDCLVACLAMVTGHDIEKIKETVSTPTPHIEALAYLSRHDKVFYQLPLVENRTVSEVLADSRVWYDSDEPIDERTAILTVESPRNDIEWHAVVYSRGDIYDPTGEWMSLEEVEARTCTFAIEVSGTDSF